MCDPTEWNTFTGVTDANVLHAMGMWLLDEENPLGLLNTKFKITRGCEDSMQEFLYVFTLFPHSSGIDLWRHCTSPDTVLIWVTDVLGSSTFLEISFFWHMEMEYNILQSTFK